MRNLILPFNWILKVSWGALFAVPKHTQCRSPTRTAERIIFTSIALSMSWLFQGTGILTACRHGISDCAMLSKITRVAFPNQHLYKYLRSRPTTFHWWEPYPLYSRVTPPSKVGEFAWKQSQHLPEITDRDQQSPSTLNKARKTNTKQRSTSTEHSITKQEQKK